MTVHRFTATPAAAGKTGNMANVELPDEVVEALGGKRVPVKVTVNGFTFATTTAVIPTIQSDWGRIAAPKKEIAASPEKEGRK